MAIILSPNMNLPVPSVGSEPGPDYATDVNNCLTLVDQHDHSPGYGVPVTPAGLNINADLSFIQNNATDVRSIRLITNALTLNTGGDSQCVYSVGGDLYYTNGSSLAIQITNSSGVAGTSGSISNLIAPASANYSTPSKTFIWQSDVLTPADMDMASVVLRNLVASSPGLTLSPPMLSSDYTITLPPLPATNLPVSIDATGTMTATPIEASQLSAALQAQLAALITPPGVLQPYAGTSAPVGYLLCDGSAVSRTTYAALYAAIGNSCGVGDGSTTFNIPDYRGRFLRGADNGAGRDPDAASRTAMNAGGNTGANVGSIQGSQFASHSHPVPRASTGDNGGLLGGNNAAPLGGTTQTQNTGGNETRPINAYVNVLIKT